MEKKQIIEVSAQVENIEHAKELLADLEVLSKKYCVSAQIFISPDQIMSCG
ncbi:hypothetical protein LXE15_001382 [Enterococcus faecium]|nr:hypothetical protein [Enterococcus faecium]EME3544690.1 hypothetical protein [Enterococcus faecium]EME8192907.1 hypothetical protein [Enterococcus faecium]EME8273581.1 hypothetical protein [Enterococcus faecium]